MTGKLVVQAMAPAARDWLRATRTARVLNVFDRACNLINPQGDILALVTSERGLTPFGMVLASPVPAPFRGLSESSPVRVGQGGLRVGPLEIAAEGAAVWDPVPDWAALRSALGADTLDSLGALAAGSAPSGSLLGIFGAAPSGGTASGAADGLDRAILERARSGAEQLVGGVRGLSEARCLAGVRALAGLGGGLTPAGDDFIVGLLLAVWAGLYGPAAGALRAPIVQLAAASTTSLSAAYVRAAGRGECTAHWHDLFAAVLRGEPAGLPAPVAALAAVGHTSGADALAGFLAVRQMPAGRAEAAR